MHNESVTIEYAVGQIIYTEDTDIPDGLYSECAYDLTPCLKPRFWVAYEEGKPTNFVVNFYINLEGIDNPQPPSTLDNFW